MESVKSVESVLEVFMVLVAMTIETSVLIYAPCVEFSTQFLGTGLVLMFFSKGLFEKSFYHTFVFRKLTVVLRKTLILKVGTDTQVSID